MRTIVIGDVHGCLEELRLLVEKLNVQKTDRVVFAGDLVDRGPFSVETVDFVRRNGWECVMGNHEEKHVRYHGHFIREAKHGIKNPMRPFDDKRFEEHMRLAEGGHIEWMEKLPPFIHLDDKWTVVHAGFLPHVPIEEQNPKQVCRIRLLNKTQAGYKMLSLDDGQPPESDHWTQVWRGPRSVVYGHDVVGDEFRVTELLGTDVRCFGIDTGCCFGGALSALVLKDGVAQGVVSVKAAREYYPRRKVQEE